jgi:methionyl-tRNA formyltransferase
VKDAFSKILEQEKYDIGVLASFGHMVPDEVIDHCKHGIYVVHPSILPKYRGASPIQRALIAGEQEVGTTVIKMSKRKFDAGPIVKTG